ncbi:MAG: sulfatase-like hydrolase/transferase [Opitutales bacterium]
MNPKRIIVMVSDQHRADVMGCAGNEIVRTPHLDQLAGAGTRFSDSFCTSPVCGPSRMSMLSGLLPSTSGVLTNRHALPSDIPTVAHALAGAGYDTVLCGRMHFIGPDQRHGFQERLVGDIGPTDAAFRELDLGPFRGLTGQGREMLKVSGPGAGPSERYDREVVDAALQRLRAQPEDRPLFMVVGTHAPHNPYVCPPDLYAHYEKALPRPDMEAIREFHAGAHPSIQTWWQARGMEGVSEDEIHRSTAAYYGMVEEMDRQIGRLLEAVDAERDLFVYLSDHGDLAGEHGMFWKSCFLDGALKVPMIWRGPGIAAGQEISGPVSLLDLAPTLTEMAGADPLPGAEGCSLTESLRSGEATSGRQVVSMLLDMRCGPACMVRTKEGCRIHHVRFSDETWGEDPGPLPTNWEDEQMERTLENVSARNRIHRKSAERSGEPLHERWEVDPRLLKTGSCDEQST